MTTKDEAIRFVLRSSQPPEAFLPVAATFDQIGAFACKYNVNVPDEMVAWLTTYNGLMVGPGGLYGIQTPRPRLDIESLYAVYPEWLENGWIPVAGDGNGNHYVLDTGTNVQEMHPIYFVDHEEGYDQPSYVVASHLWTFLAFLLAKDAKNQPGAALWPFDKTYVLSKDPALALYKGPVALPWDA